MDQRWTRLPLPVIFLLFWRNADGFKGGTYSDAHHGWGQPSDAFSPHAVQSSVSEVHVTGILPVEEVGSSLFPKKPLKSKSKLNLLQFVKGGSSNYQSASHVQTAYGTLRQPQDTASQSALKSPSSYASVSLSSPQAGPSTTVQGSHKQLASTYMGSSGNQAGSSSFSLQGSTAYGGSHQPQDAASQSAPGSQSYATVSLSSPQAGPSTTVQGSRKQLPSIYTGSSGTHAGSSTPFILHGSTAYGASRQPQDTASQSALKSPSSYASVSLSSPQAGPSTTRGSQKQFTSAYQGSSGAQFGASTDFSSQDMSRSYSGFVQSKGTTSQFSPVSSPYASVSLSSPQAGPSTTVQGSQKQLASTYMGSSGNQAGSSSFSLQGSTAYGGSHQPQDAASPSAPGSQSYASLSSPQAGPSTVPGSLKQFTFTLMGSPDTQAGSSTPFILQGSTAYGGSPQPQDTASQFAPGSPSLYPGLSLSSPQAGPSTTVQGSRKQLDSTYMGSSGTQAGSSTPFILHGSTAYGASRQPQDTASQSALKSPSSYASVSLSSPQAGPSTVPGSLKQFTFTLTGSPDTQAGSSTPFILQGSTAYGGSPQPQDTASQFAPGSPSLYPGLSVSSPQAGPSTTVQGSRKQLDSTYMGSSGTQAGSSSLSLQGSTAYGGSPQPQDTASQISPGSSSSYPGLSVSSPQAGPSTVLGFLKQLSFTFMSSPGTQAGFFTPFTLQGSVTYDGSPQPQGSASQFAPVSPSYPSVLSPSQGVASQSTIQGSLKKLASTFTGSSGTQAGSSTPFALQGGTAYGGSSQPKDPTSWSAPGPHSSYASASLSSPQAGPSTVQASQKRFTSGYQGSSGAQFGASTGFASQRMSSSSSGLVQSQGTTSQFAPGSPSYLGLSLSSPQDGPSTNAQGSLKRLASTFVGSSGTQAGSSTAILQGNTAYGGSSQPQDTASEFAPGSQSSYASVSLSSPQAVAGPGTAQSSQKQFISTSTGSSGKLL